MPNVRLKTRTVGTYQSPHTCLGTTVVIGMEQKDCEWTLCFYEDYRAKLMR